MKTTQSNFGAGHLAASSLDNRGAVAPARTVDRQLLRIWQYRRLLRSPLFQPFQKVLRPLLRWVFQSHLFVYDESHDVPVRVNLKPLSLATLVLSVLLAPLLFVMLLPLVLILVPLAALFAMLGTMFSTAQTDEEDIDHHSLAWHVMH